MSDNSDLSGLPDAPAPDGISSPELSDRLLSVPTIWTNKFYTALQGQICRLSFCEGSGEVEKPRINVAMTFGDMIALRDLLSRMVDLGEPVDPPNA